MATRSKRRKAARAAKFERQKPCANGVTESMKMETNGNAQAAPTELAGLGERAGLIGETKLPRMLARAVNWQQDNRFPLHKTESEIRQETQERGETIYEQIALNAVDLMKSEDPRAKAAGVRAGVGMARLVQADDHKKLASDDSVMPQPVVMNQINVDQRRVYVMQLPSNGRASQNE